MIFISSSALNSSSIEITVKELVGIGIRNIELSGGTAYADNILETLKNLKSEFSLHFLVHNYFPPPKKDFVLNIASKDRVTRSKSIDFVKKSIDLSHDLGSDIYTLHAGYAKEMLPAQKGDYFLADSSSQPRDPRQMKMRWLRFARHDIPGPCLNRHGSKHFQANCSSRPRRVIARSRRRRGDLLSFLRKQESRDKILFLLDSRMRGNDRGKTLSSVARHDSMHFPSNPALNTRPGTASAMMYESLAEIRDYAVKKGIRIGLENLFPIEDAPDCSLLSIPEDIIPFLDDFCEDDHVGFLLDLGHLLLSANHSGFDKDEFIEILRKDYPHKILEIHLSGNDGKKDEHALLAPDCWQLKAARAFNLEKSPVTIECRGVTTDEISKQYQMVQNILEG